MLQHQDKKQQIEKNLMSIEITDREFDNFAALIYKLTGIFITDKKRQLVISRLSKRLKLHGFDSFSSYYDYLLAPEGSSEIVEFINQITTNKTDFYREAHHFDYVSQSLIPQVLQRGEKNLRFWSAGCSTGEEPYTLAITVLETLEGLKARQGIDVKILATDLDTNVMKRTMTGIYEESKLAVVPVELRKKYFSPEGPGLMEAKQSLKNLITVKRLNLMNPYPFRKGFNGIFCRNVLIYFTQEDRRKVVQKMHHHIRPGGFLFLGHSESLLADTMGFRNLGHTIYQKV
jgi:chemotaxis protein methyltransferase CheR